MSITKKVISYILSILLAINTISIVLLITLNTSIFNKSYVKKQLRNTDYYYYVYNIIDESCKNTIMQSGFEENVFKDVISERKVTDDVDILVDCLYDNKEVNISAEPIRQALRANIQKEIDEKKYVVNSETQASINEFVETIVSTYKSNILYSEEAIKQIRVYMEKIIKFIRTAIIVLCITELVLLVVTYILYKPGLGISLIVSGVFFIVVNVYSGVNVAINNVLILNWAFSKSVIYVLNQLITNLLKVGIAFTCVGTVIILLGEFIRIKLLNKKKN